MWGIWEVLGNEGGVFINGISVLIKENPQNSLVSITMWEHSKKIPIYEPGSGSSPDTEPARTLILDLLGSRTTEK